VALLLAPNADVTTQQYPHLRFGMLVLLCSSFLWSAGSIYSRRAQNAPSPFLAVGQQMICGGGLMLVAGVLTGELPRFDVHRVTWLSLGRLGVSGAHRRDRRVYRLHLAARHCDPAKVATYAYVNPNRGGDAGRCVCR
jgi:drug/metabolite transporter (DMT)-like permease